jgi:hypothetical protein
LKGENVPEREGGFIINVARCPKSLTQNSEIRGKSIEEYENL